MTSNMKRRGRGRGDFGDGQRKKKEKKDLQRCQSCYQPPGRVGHLAALLTRRGWSGLKGCCPGFWTRRDGRRLFGKEEKALVLNCFFMVI